MRTPWRQTHGAMHYTRFEKNRMCWNCGVVSSILTEDLGVAIFETGLGLVLEIFYCHEKSLLNIDLLLSVNR